MSFLINGSVVNLNSNSLSQSKTKFNNLPTFLNSFGEEENPICFESITKEPFVSFNLPLSVYSLSVVIAVVDFKKSCFSVYHISQVIFIIFFNYFLQFGFVYYILYIVRKDFVTCIGTPFLLQFICVFSYFVICWGDLKESVDMILFIVFFPVDSSIKLRSGKENEELKVYMTPVRRWLF